MSQVSTPKKGLRHIGERIKDWLVREAGTKHAQYLLGVLSFIESSFFPIPPDIFLVPMILAHREKWKRLTLIVITTSVAGALLGYVIGVGLWDVVGERIIDIYNLADEMARLTEIYEQQSFWALFLAALTPLPFKVFTIASGVFKMNIFTFVIASIIGRGLRFGVEGYLVYQFGKKLAHTVFHYFNWFILFTGLVVIAYVMLH